jgi:uncharacterized membrane protein
MRQSLSTQQWIIFIAALLLIFVIFQIELIKFAADKLGLPSHGMVLLLFVSLLGSMINLPLLRIHSNFDPEKLSDLLKEVLDYRSFTPGYTQIAINLGGAIIPLSFSVFLLVHQSLPLLAVLVAITVTGTVSYLLSRPIANIGIGMPVLVAPVTAALAAVILAPQQSAPVAYISGTLGVLIGADLLRLKDIRQLSVPIAAIGGAGTFDGIFLTGLIAVLLT